MENAMRLKELSDELHANINDLLSGNLTPEQTPHLVDLCSELYEKLIVLRFKAFSESVTPAEKMQAVLETVQPIKIDTSPVQPAVELVNQVNLIDAIKEVEQDTNALQDSSKDAMQDSSKDAMQDSSKDAEQEEEEEEEEIVFQLIPNKEPMEETPVISLAKDVPKQEEEKIEVKPPVSLNDTFKENASLQGSLAKKLEGSAISDLKKNISLNQRFQFCKDLFKGNNQEYELMLEKLNNTNKEEALRILQSLKDKFAWNADSMAAKDFTDLVNRRYMA